MGPMIQTSTLWYKKPINIKIIEVTILFYLFINDCEVLIVDSLIQELELAPLKVEYLKGRTALVEGGSPPSKSVVLRMCGILFY